MPFATIHDAAQLARMRPVCRIVADCLRRVAPRIRPGLTTAEVDGWVAEELARHGATTGMSALRGFPGVACVSVNEEACHGVPGPRVLRDGDIVKVDVVARWPDACGYHGDTSATFYVGEPSADVRRVVEAARAALAAGISAVRPGNRLGDVGAAVHAAALAYGCDVVRGYNGHGIGREVHARPVVRHHGRPGEGELLVPGLTFTIEPIVTAGTPAATRRPGDPFTVVTVDGAPAAQFEHTVVVTEDGVEVLTVSDAGP